MSTHVPLLLAALVDDAAVFPPGSAPLAEALPAHRALRATWYAELVGPLLVPTSGLNKLGALLGDGERLAVGVVGDTGLAGLSRALSEADPRLRIRQVELAVAKRGEDPQPGLAALVRELGSWPALAGYAEIPLAWGLLAALDTVASARASGVAIAPKFRTGGLAAELFPSPVELATVICACRDRALPFKLTAGLHHALRYADRETGFVHHGFLNVLAGVLAADDDASVTDVAGLLGGTDPVPLLEAVRPYLAQHRPLWIGFGTCSVEEPLDDLVQLGLVVRA